MNGEEGRLLAIKHLLVPSSIAVLLSVWPDAGQMDGSRTLINTAFIYERWTTTLMHIDDRAIGGQKPRALTKESRETLEDPMRENKTPAFPSRKLSLFMIAWCNPFEEDLAAGWCLVQAKIPFLFCRSAYASDRNANAGDSSDLLRKRRSDGIPISCLVIISPDPDFHVFSSFALLK